MRGIILLYLILTVYILAVNFYSFRLVRTQAEDGESGDKLRSEDARQLLADAVGGALAVFITMPVLRSRPGNHLHLVALPRLAVSHPHRF